MEAGLWLAVALKSQGAMWYLSDSLGHLLRSQNGYHTPGTLSLDNHLQDKKEVRLRHCLSLSKANS